MVETGAGGFHRTDFSKLDEDVIPEVHNTYNLGSDTKSWAYIYAIIAVLTSITLGGIYLGATAEGYFFINASTQINGSLNVNDNITADYYFGNASQMSGLPSGGNESWNQSLANTLYADISVTGDNESWNESLADTLYCDINDCNSSWNESLADNLYCAINNCNISWNESLANTLYAGIQWDYNQTTATYNLYDERWTSTFNSTYDAKISDNESWNETRANNLYVNIEGDTMTGSLVVNENITASWFLGLFNWTTLTNWLSFDGATLSFNTSNLETTYFLANTTQVITGTGAGNLEDIQSYNLVFYNVTEDDSDYELIVNFTEITEFTTLIIRHKVDESDGHSAAIQMWNYDDSRWDGYGYLSEETTSTIQTFGVYDDDKHISDGVVQVRFYQEEGPPNYAHIHQFDWVGISKGYGTPVGEEIDPLSIHKDGQIPLTGNWNAGLFNITASWFKGFLNWSNVQNAPVSEWLSTFNTTYDAKVSFPGWSSNLAWINESNTFTASQSLTGQNISAIDCIIFDSGGKICSGV